MEEKKEVCAYCGKEIEPCDLIYRIIFSPKYKDFKSDPRPYHWLKFCADKDQIGHEG